MWRIYSRKNCTDHWKKISQNDYYLSFFYQEYFFIGFFSESLENFILSKINHKKFQSDKNYMQIFYDQPR